MRYVYYGQKLTSIRYLQIDANFNKKFKMPKSLKKHGMPKTSNVNPTDARNIHHRGP